MSHDSVKQLSCIDPLSHRYFIYINWNGIMEYNYDYYQLLPIAQTIESVIKSFISALLIYTLHYIT